MTETDFGEYMAQDRRIAILVMLSKVEGKASESVLHRALKDTLFPRLTREQLRAELDWLRQRHLVTHDFLDGALLVATLTARGLDAAQGDIAVAGLARPSRIK